MTNREIVNGIVAQRVATGSVSWEFLIEQALDEATKRGALQMRERVTLFLEQDGWNDGHTSVNQKVQAFAYAKCIRALPLIEGESK